MYWNRSRRAWSRVAWTPVADPLGLEGVEEAFIGALSQQSPLQLIEGVMPDLARLVGKLSGGGSALARAAGARRPC